MHSPQISDTSRSSLYTCLPLSEVAAVRMSVSDESVSIASDASIRLGTWNLRYDVMPDNITVQETIANLKDHLVEPDPYHSNPVELPWSTRRTYVSSTLLHERVQLIGTYTSITVGPELLISSTLYCKGSRRPSSAR